MPRVNKQQIVDAICRSELRSFIQEMFAVYAPGDQFIPGSYIDAIAYHLSEVAAGRMTRLIINMPPRYLKSFCASVAYPAWVLGHDPTQQVICVSYSNDLSKKHANDFRSLIQSRRYRRIFPGFRINRSKNTELEVETTRRGFRLSTSVEGTFTGRGGNIIVIDDPINAADAHSLAAIEKVNEWFKSTVYSRLNNKETGAIVLVMQRLHVDDLSAELAYTGDWTVLNLPAIATSEQTVQVGHDRYFSRKAGEALHPEREPLETLRKTESVVGPAAFSAQYLQAPVPAEGQILDPKWFNYYDEVPKRDENTRRFLAMDTAAKSGPRNDFSVILAMQRQGDNYYVLDVVRQRIKFPELRNLAVAMREKHKTPIVVIEDASSGTQLIQDLKATKRLAAIGWKPMGDKMFRAYSIQTVLMDGRLYLPRKAPWLHAFVHEIASFPSRHDDQVDALTMALLWDQQRERVTQPDIGIPSNTDNYRPGDEMYGQRSIGFGIHPDIVRDMFPDYPVAVCSLGSALYDDDMYDGDFHDED
ncbi:MAG: phage terminase large subunit [Rhodobacteraceae bacterium]|nr:phage terminase large subunit [Paracoccaceae bacterium]